MYSRGIKNAVEFNDTLKRDGMRISHTSCLDFIIFISVFFTIWGSFKLNR